MLLRRLSNRALELKRFVSVKDKTLFSTILDGVPLLESGIIRFPALVISDRTGERPAWWVYDGRNGMIHRVWAEHVVPHGSVYYLTDTSRAVMVGTLKESLVVEPGRELLRNDDDYMVLFHQEDHTVFRVVRYLDLVPSWKDRYGYCSDTNPLLLALIPMPNRPDIEDLHILAKLSGVIPVVRGSRLYQAEDYFTLETPHMTSYFDGTDIATFYPVTMPTSAELEITVDGRPAPWLLELDPSAHSISHWRMDFKGGRWVLSVDNEDKDRFISIYTSYLRWYPGLSVDLEDAMKLVQAIASEYGGLAFMLLDPAKSSLGQGYYRYWGVSISTVLAWTPIDGEMHLVVPLNPARSGTVKAWMKTNMQSGDGYSGSVTTCQ